MHTFPFPFPARNNFTVSAPIKDGKAILEELTGQRKEEAEDEDLDWDEEVLGEMEGGEPNDRFANYWNDDTGMTYPLILAKIPVKNPWEIFAYLPWNPTVVTDKPKRLSRSLTIRYLKSAPWSL